ATRLTRRPPADQPRLTGLWVPELAARTCCEIPVPGSHHHRLVLDEIANPDDSALNDRQGAPAEVHHKPLRAGYRRRAIPALRAVVALTLAPKAPRGRLLRRRFRAEPVRLLAVLAL